MSRRRTQMLSVSWRWKQAPRIAVEAVEQVTEAVQSEATSRMAHCLPGEHTTKDFWDGVKAAGHRVYTDWCQANPVAASLPKDRKPSAPLVVTVRKWSNSGELVFSPCIHYDGSTSDVSWLVYQYQLVHDDPQSLTADFISEFSAAMHMNGFDWMHKMEKGERIKFAGYEGEGTDPDNVGVKAGRASFYFMDRQPYRGLKWISEFAHARRLKAEFFNIEAPALVLSPWPDGDSVRIPGGWTKLPDDCIAHPEPHIFDAPPPLGERHITLDIDTRKEGRYKGQYTFLWYGGIRAYDSKFEEHGVKGCFIQLDNVYRYVRYLRLIEFNDDSKKRIASIMGDGVFNGRAIFVVNVTGDLSDAFVEWVMAMENAHCR